MASMNKEKVVLLGDSMIDTYDFMDEGFPELKRELGKISSNLSIELVNHGVGSTDVNLGLKRVTQPYDYEARGRKLPAVLDENAGLVVIESFAYNHGSNSSDDINAFLDSHRKIVDLLRPESKIVLLATVAPNRDNFATGIISLGWDENKRQQEYELVMRYFQEFIEFAKNSGLPFVNIFEMTLTENKTGDPKYISNVDYLHLSFEGRELISRELAPVISRLLTKEE